ncbi:hypothetical protein M413DRAFT_130441 [Hebeloma cylindrosporum]|uniref:Uncharacterized protein n=1 Tax=Hebeloma cylindrosporum TaxID=76867 RepID=A0A0C2YMP7_HEBCY|nr:hypothetical protein M413DRAFT_130441 [Hebeloma cylindrosporum h7]
MNSTRTMISLNSMKRLHLRLRNRHRHQRAAILSLMLRVNVVHSALTVRSPGVMLQMENPNKGGSGPIRKSRKSSIVANDDVDSDGMYYDVHVQGIEDSHDDSESESGLGAQEIFYKAAIQWLIETNQPLQALNHPSFKKMISIAARADRDIKFPSRDEIRQAIMERRGHVE